MTTSRTTTDPATGWRAVFDDFGMADVYCVDPECDGDYLPRRVALDAIHDGRGLCAGCQDAHELGLV